MNVPENIVEQIIGDRRKKIRAKIYLHKKRIDDLLNSAVVMTEDPDRAVKKIQKDHMDSVEMELKELTKLELILEGLEKLNKTK